MHFKGSFNGTVSACSKYFPGGYLLYSCGDTCTLASQRSLYGVCPGWSMCIAWNVNGDYHMSLNGQFSAIITEGQDCPSNCEGIENGNGKYVRETDLVEFYKVF